MSIGLTDSDAVSRESGIDDASLRFPSRGPSSCNLLELDAKSDSLKSESLNDEEDKFTHRHSYQWNKALYLRLLKWLLFILYNVYLIVGVNRTWSKVSKKLFALLYICAQAALCLIMHTMIINTLLTLN